MWCWVIIPRSCLPLKVVSGYRDPQLRVAENYTIIHFRAHRMLFSHILDNLTYKKLITQLQIKNTVLLQKYAVVDISYPYVG